MRLVPYRCAGYKFFCASSLCLFFVYRQPETLDGAIKSIIENNLRGETFQFEIRREVALQDMLSETKTTLFHPLKKVKIWFVGETGEDTGGLTREAWCLLGRALERICEGRPGFKIPRHDAAKLQVMQWNPKSVDIL